MIISFFLIVFRAGSSSPCAKKIAALRAGSSCPYTEFWSGPGIDEEAKPRAGGVRDRRLG